jgi:ribosome biogenesis GTPase
MIVEAMETVEDRERVACVISLDRGYPLVLPADSKVPLRAQHAIDLVKNAQVRAVVGDRVELDFPPGQDTPLITRILPRTHELVRRSLVESRHEGAGKHVEQVLAANFDEVIVVTALSRHPLDQDYLERQLVMAHESGARVVLWLTKLDQAHDAAADEARARASAPNCTIYLFSVRTREGLEQLESAFKDTIAVLLGRSGVGKSTVANELIGENLQATGEVRERDRAGRHTTVARKMVFLPGNGVLIDTPGLRSIGLYGAHGGLAATFSEITALAASCHYRDCTHTHEPGCAVTAAVQVGTLPLRRLTAYHAIRSEVED